MNALRSLPDEKFDAMAELFEKRAPERPATRLDAEYVSLMKRAQLLVDDGAFRGTVEQCFASLFTKKKFVPEGSDETDDDDVEPDATCDRIG